MEGENDGAVADASVEPMVAPVPEPQPELVAPQPEPEPQPAAVALIDRWWDDNFPGSPVARVTEAWNHAFAAKEELKRLLAAL